ncbi:MAG: MFS transporter, partial [Pedosphaera parvula]|nr:MFS transporter [Pedosphaera parvula]
AYIADVTTPENRSKGMGMIGMAFGLGFILGPALGAFSASVFGLQGPGWVAAGFCGANLILASFILIESRKPSSEHAATRPNVEQWVHTFQQKKLAFLNSLFFLSTFCFAVVESTLPLLLNESFNYDEKRIGYLFAYCGVMTAFTQGGVIGRLVKRFGEPQLISASLMILAVAMALIPYAPHLGEMLLGLGLFAIGSGINRAPTMGLISMSAPAHEQGATLGVTQSVGTLARIIGPVAGTWLFFVYAPLPYLLCAGIAIFSGILAWQYLHRPATARRAATLVEAGEKASAPSLPND